jgi:uncharacterized protein YegP (UPF0339 family)
MKFQTYQSTLNKEFYFRFLHSDGRQLLRSEGYKNKDGMMNAIQSVKKNSMDNEAFEVKQTSRGNLMFNLKAKNHQVIATSIVFESKTDMQEAKRYIKANAASATIEDQRPV